MARIRTIKPEWLEDESMILASPAARVLSVALILMADDYGRGRGNPDLIVSRIFPGHSREGFEGWKELACLQFFHSYTVRGQTYYEIRNWEKHQRVDRPGKPRVPPPSDPDAKAIETPENVPGSLAPDRDHDHDLDHDQGPNGGGASAPPPSKPKRKAKVHPQRQDLIDFFHERYVEFHNGAKPTWNGKARGMADQLLKAHPFDEVTRRIEILFTAPPPWITTRDMATLVQHFDKLAKPHTGPESAARRIAQQAFQLRAEGK